MKKNEQIGLSLSDQKVIEHYDAVDAAYRRLVGLPTHENTNGPCKQSENNGASN